MKCHLCAGEIAFEKNPLTGVVWERCGCGVNRHRADPFIKVTIDPSILNLDPNPRQMEQRTCEICGTVFAGQVGKHRTTCSSPCLRRKAIAARTVPARCTQCRQSFLARKGWGSTVCHSCRKKSWQREFRLRKIAERAARG